MEARANLDKALNGSGKNSKKDDDESAKNKRKRDEEEPKGRLKCDTCGKRGHKADDCWSDPKNADKRPRRDKRANAGKEQLFTAEQFQFLISQLPSMAATTREPKRKRMVSDDPVENTSFMEMFKNSTRVRDSSESSDSE